MWTARTSITARRTRRHCSARPTRERSRPPTPHPWRSSPRLSTASTRWSRRCHSRSPGMRPAPRRGTERRSRPGSSTTPRSTRPGTSSTSGSRPSSRPSRVTSHFSTCSSTSTLGGSFENLINTAGGAQDSRIVGGSQKISIEVAKRLGGSVVLDAPVHRIKHRAGRVEVHTPRGTWEAKRAIVTVPPTLAGRIQYQPHLPGPRDQLTQRVPMGSVIKCMAVYERPFWREDGLSGMATSDTGPVKVTFDNSPPSGKPGVMLGFIEGQEARNLTRKSKRERRKAVLGSLELYFGSAARTDARDYFDKSWAEDPWTRGCYVGYLPTGVLTGYRDAIHHPVGPIHWAGTETATEWNGYMDGAVQSGERAADEVLSEL